MAVARGRDQVRNETLPFVIALVRRTLVAKLQADRLPMNKVIRLPRIRSEHLRDNQLESFRCFFGPLAYQLKGDQPEGQIRPVPMEGEGQKGFK